MAESRIDELRRRLQRDPGSRLFAQLAEELRRNGELADAIGVARAGLEKNPGYPSARLTLGRALLDSGDPAAARVELEAAVEGAPDNILANRLLGEALETLGDLGEALEQYSRTLQIAPGERHVEARIRAIQARLGAPGDGREAGRSDTTAPVKTFADGDFEDAEDEDDGEDIPPTIRIRMPGDSLRPGRAPLPPVPRDPGRADTPLPRSVPPTAKPARGRAPATEAGLPASQLPTTRPMAGVEGSEAGIETGGREAPADEAALPDRGPGPGMRVPVFKTPALDPAVEAPAAKPVAPAPTPGEAPAAPTLSAPNAPRAEGEPARGAGTAPAPGASQHPAHGATVPGGPAAARPRGRVPDSGIEDAAVAAADAGRAGAADGVGVAASARSSEVRQAAESAPLSSATLAELYFEQGLVERAVEVYAQVLAEEPGNERARVRLAELESIVSGTSADPTARASGIGADTEVRRRALERAIERLEALLAIARRR